MPLYTEIMDELITGIRNGKYQPNSVLPSEKEICERFKVSRTSVRNALKAMQEKGYIDRRQGSGSFVLEQKANSINGIINLGIILNQNPNHSASAITGSAYFSTILKGIQSSASAFRANPSMFIYDDSRKITGQDFPGYRIDGYLDVGNTISPNLNQYFKEHKCKVCSIFNSFHEHEYKYDWPVVINDYLSGVRDAVKYYKSLGITKFGFFAMAKMGVTTFDQFRKVLREEGVDFDLDSVVLYPDTSAQLSYMRERAEYFYNKLFASGTRPEVLFSDGFFIVDELMRLLNESEQGRKILEEIHLCGITDPGVEKISYPEKPDLVVPSREQAAVMATEILVRSIRQGTPGSGYRTYAPSKFFAAGTYKRED